MAQQILPWLMAALVFLAVVTDVRGYIIPNWVSAAIAGLAVVQVFLLGLGPAAWPYLACGVVVLIVGFVLFACNWLGAGDVKLLAALALWSGPAGTVGLITWTALAGGVLAVLVLLIDRIRRPAATAAGVNAAPRQTGEPPSAPSCAGNADRGENGGPEGRRPLPYAAAIAGGVVYLFVHGQGLVLPGV